MKNTLSLALILLTLLLAACSAAPTSEATAGSPSTGLAASLPKPNPAQQDALLAAFARINPRLSNDHAVEAARGLCGRLLGQSSADQLIAAAKAAFTNGDVPVVSDEEAQRILSAIGANGFCR